MQAEGIGGQLRFGYHVAAEIGRWSLHETELLPVGHQVQLEYASTNDFWLDRDGPFELRLRLGRLEWRWREVPKPDGGLVTVPGRPQTIGLQVLPEAI